MTGRREEMENKQIKASEGIKGMWFLRTAFWTPARGLPTHHWGNPIWAFFHLAFVLSQSLKCQTYTSPHSVASSPCMLLKEVGRTSRQGTYTGNRSGSLNKREITNLSCSATFKKTKENLARARLVYCRIERRHTSLRNCMGQLSIQSQRKPQNL